MTDISITSLIASVAPTIAAIGALIVGIRNSRKADKIEYLVDGNLSKVQNELENTKKELKDMRILLMSLRPNIRETDKGTL